MKKERLIRLIKFYVEHNDSAFRNEVTEIAKDFEQSGDKEISEYLLSLIEPLYVPRAKRNLPKLSLEGWDGNGF